MGRTPRAGTPRGGGTCGEDGPTLLPPWLAGGTGALGRSAHPRGRRGGAGVTWRPGDDLLLHCAGREPALGMEVGCRRETSQRQARRALRGGHCPGPGVHLRVRPGPASLGLLPAKAERPLSGSCPSAPPGLLQADRDPSASHPPAPSPRVRLARGLAPPSGCSRPVSSHAGISPHTVPVCESYLVCLSEAGEGALTSPPDTLRSQSRRYKQRCIHPAEREGGKGWVGIEMAELSIFTVST